MTTAAVDVRCITTAQLSEKTGINQATLRQWRRNKKPPQSFRANGVVLYRLAVVEAWLAESEAAEHAREIA